MNKKIIGFLFLIGLMITGCSTKDYFGELSDKEILLFQLEGQSGSTKIDGDKIYVKVTDDLYLTSLTSLSASKFIILYSGYFCSINLIKLLPINPAPPVTKISFIFPP